ncbi:MAG: RNase adaptor protein RapZ, partial [Proteobacteria bacterium]|nr:RNase adaptor protein RapZ [Pseudomonadota bacterium]
LMVDSSLKTLSEALNKERSLLSKFREVATRIIDTTSFSIHQLRREIEGFFEFQVPLEIVVQSFGFKHGVPYDSDLIVDVRFLPNPYFVPELKEKTGLEENVKEYVFKSPEAMEFIDKYTSLLEFLLPKYQKEGKRYLTVGIGCTGGKHRSVAIATTICEKLSALGFQISVRHRDIERS